MKEERRFDLKEVFYRIVASWKIIIIVAVVGAVAGGVFSYSQSKKEVAAQQAAKEAQGQAGNEVATLSDSDNIAAQTYASFVKMLNEQMDYLDHSILMNLDAGNVYKKVLMGYVDTRDSGEKDDLEAAARLNKNLERYCSVANNEATYTAAADTLGEDITEKELNELVTASIVSGVAQSNCFQVVIYGKDEEMADVLADCIRAAINEKSTELGQNLSLVEAEAGFCFDQIISEKQRVYLTNMNGSRATMKSLEDALTDQQKIYAQKILDGTLEEYLASVSVPEEIVVGTASVDMKYMILAAILFVLLWIVIVIVNYIFTANVRSDKEYEEYFNLSVLGDASGIIAQSKSAFSKWILKRQGVETEDLSDLISTQIAHMVNGQQICLAGCGDSGYMKVSDTIASKLKEKGVESSVVSTWLTKSEDVEVASRSKGIVLLVRHNREKCETINKMVSKCEQINVKVLGVVIY